MLVFWKPVVLSASEPCPSAVLLAPVVVALRQGLGFVAVFVTPHARARVTGLKAGEWQIDWATGDLWSRSCFRFMAGMRGRRTQDVEVPPVITLPDDQGTDIPDQSFGR